MGQAPVVDIFAGKGYVVMRVQLRMDLTDDVVKNGG